LMWKGGQLVIKITQDACHLTWNPTDEMAETVSVNGCSIELPPGREVISEYS
jgi:hypothetical protein